MFFDLFDFLKILKTQQHNYNQSYANFWFWVRVVNHWHLWPWIKFSNLKFFSSSLIILWGALEYYVPVIFILLDLSAEVVLQSNEILKVRSSFWWGTVGTMDKWGLYNLKLSPPVDNETAAMWGQGLIQHSYDYADFICTKKLEKIKCYLKISWKLFSVIRSIISDRSTAL